MISFIAFTPHSPLLIPSIGKKNLEKLEDTTAAFKSLSLLLSESEPEIIVVLSAHGVSHEDAFSINFHSHYEIDLREFGDLVTKKTFMPDSELVDDIQRRMRTESIPFTLDSSGALDYGIGVPLALLTDKLKNVKITPISYSNLSAKDHVEFGRVLKDILENSKKRIAVIASGDLSHCLSSDAPMGFKKEGQKFDEIVKQAISDLSISKLLSLDPEFVKDASECAYQPLMILFGIIERMRLKPEILSYESPFGVGYLVANFRRL